MLDCKSPLQSSSECARGPLALFFVLLLCCVCLPACLKNSKNEGEKSRYKAAIHCMVCVCACERGFSKYEGLPAMCPLLVFIVVCVLGARAQLAVRKSEIQRKRSRYKAALILVLACVRLFGLHGPRAIFRVESPLLVFFSVWCWVRGPSLLQISKNSTPKNCRRNLNKAGATLCHGVCAS